MADSRLLSEAISEKLGASAEKKEVFDFPKSHLPTVMRTFAMLLLSTSAFGLRMQIGGGPRQSPAVHRRAGLIVAAVSSATLFSRPLPRP